MLDGEFAIQVARESVTLLKNDGILPLNSTFKNIVLAGPAGNTIGGLSGSYTFHRQGASTFPAFVMDRGLSPSRDEGTPGELTHEFVLSPRTGRRSRVGCLFLRLDASAQHQPDRPVGSHHRILVGLQLH
jgi:beta-glucosidase-like glycosyl hydrolase